MAVTISRGFAAGPHLARRAQGWNMARLQYKNDDRVTVRFHLPDKDYAEVQRLKSFFGRAKIASSKTLQRPPQSGLFI